MRSRRVLGAVVAVLVAAATFGLGQGTASAGPNDPFGNVESVTRVPGGLKFTGWAIDPNTTGSISVQAYVAANNQSTVANISRPDVGAAYPAYGSNHGFSVTVPVPSAGTHNYCVYALNVAAGTNTTLSCATFNVEVSPKGNVESVTRVPGGIRFTGWALDPDSAGAISVQAYVGATNQAVSANGARPDVGEVHPGYGSNHGFDVIVPVTTPGTHSYCVYALDVGLGSNTTLGCSSFTVSGDPIGHVESITRIPGGGVRFTGWVLDPDTNGSISVQGYVGANNAGATANQSRPDVAAVYPGYGAAHGFEVTVAAPSWGTHGACVYGINVGSGSTGTLMCDDIHIGNPFGSLDQVTTTDSSVTFAGWAIDPDTTAAISVQAYVGGNNNAALANGYRPDVGAAYPGYGNNHGYSVTVSAGSGTHPYCVYLLNQGDGATIDLKCGEVRIGNDSIVDIARAEVGVQETPMGSNCNPYTYYWGRASSGGCAPQTAKQPWCSDFAQWVWEEAGIDTSGITGYSLTFVDYGRRHGTFHTSDPKPGDAVVWGTTNLSHGEHVGIVSDVSGSSIRVINGNWGNAVDEDWLALTFTLGDEDYPIIGFVSPA